LTKLEAWISKFLFSEDNSEKGLRNPQKVYDLLNIQPRGKIILISGTNGKGTTGEILTQLGLQKGLKVGTFSSPHLIRINERIKINGESISDDLFLNTLETVRKAKGDIPLNFFQYLALTMMKIFNDENIDLWIIEIGIGGRLDPTNILKADLSIITNVQLDHEEILGKGIENIAKEKAGIIKENQNFVFGHSYVPNSLKKEIRIKNASSSILKKDFEIKKNKKNILYFDKKNQFKLDDKKNIGSSSIAVAIRSFISLGIMISENQIQKAMDSFSIKGRCEVISENPFILIDVCHNLGALEKLKKELLKSIEGKKTAAIFATSKNSYDLISPLKGMIDCWYFPRCKEKRLLNPEQFLTSVDNDSLGSCGESLEITYKKIKNKSEYDAIIIYGSFYLIGEFLESNLV
jgi:dihydrofolate synthase/folylpolyglutamate synthase